MKKKNGLIIKTAIVVLLAGSWLMACRREVVSNHPTGTDPRAVLPTGQYSVIYTQLPADSFADVTREVGMRFSSVVAGTITKLSFYKTVGEPAGTHKGYLWDSAGNILDSGTFTSETSRGWQFVTLATPYAVTPNKTLIVSVNETGKYAATVGGLGTQLNNGPLSSKVGNNGVYSSGTGLFPSTASSNNANYFRDVVFVPTVNDGTPPTAPTNVAASSITKNSATITWTAATDNIGVTGYDVYKNGYLLASIGNVTSYSAVHLNEGGLNVFQVLAKDAFGNHGPLSTTEAYFSTLNPSGIADGSVLTTAMVGPGAIGITSFTTVAGGSFSGTALSGWGSLARTVAAGGETIDGFWFPAGTVVLQGADVSSLITVLHGWLVLRGCKGNMLGANPVGDDGGIAALYCAPGGINSGGRDISGSHYQPVETIVHRCYFPHVGLENVYSDNVTVTENWITPDGGGVGEHVDGIQTWGGQRLLNFSRNHMQFNLPDPNSTLSALCGVYTDGTQLGYGGFDHMKIQKNYFIDGPLGYALHAPLNQPVKTTEVSGNRWTWESSVPDKDHTGAVYPNAAWTIPNYHTDGNNWSNNKWATGPYKDSFLLPNNHTSTVEY